VRYLPLFVLVVEHIVKVSHGLVPDRIAEGLIIMCWRESMWRWGTGQTHPSLARVCKIPATVCKGYEATLSSASPGMCFDGNLLRAFGETPEYFKSAKVFPLQS